MIHFHSIREILSNPAAVAIAGVIFFKLYRHAHHLGELVIKDAGAGKPASHYHVLVLLQFAAIGSGLLMILQLVLFVLGAAPGGYSAALAALFLLSAGVFTVLTVAWSRRRYPAPGSRSRPDTTPEGDAPLPSAEEMLARRQRRQWWLDAAFAGTLGLLLGGSWLGWEAWRDATLSAPELAERIPARTPLPVVMDRDTATPFAVVKIEAFDDDLRFTVVPQRIPAGLDYDAQAAWAAEIGYGKVCRLLEPFRATGIDPSVRVSREVGDGKGRLLVSTQHDIGACLAYQRLR